MITAALNTEADDEPPVGMDFLGFQLPIPYRRGGRARCEGASPIEMLQSTTPNE